MGVFTNRRNHGDFIGRPLQHDPNFSVQRPTFLRGCFSFCRVIAEDVILKTVAVGLGDSDAVAGGAVYESQFGQFSHAFAAETAGGDVNPA